MVKNSKRTDIKVETKIVTTQISKNSKKATPITTKTTTHIYEQTIEIDDKTFEIRKINKKLGNLKECDLFIFTAKMVIMK